MRPEERRRMLILCAVILVISGGVFAFLTSGVLGHIFDPVG